MSTTDAAPKGFTVTFGDGCDDDTLNLLFGTIKDWTIQITDDTGANDVTVTEVAPGGRWALMVRDYIEGSEGEYGEEREVDVDNITAIHIY